MSKILLVLYDDPVSGYPETYARDDVPTLERYPDGQTMPTPEAIDFTPGELAAFQARWDCGSSGGPGLKLVVTSDKDGARTVCSIVNSRPPRSSFRSRSGRRT
jgi:formate dehydrogenase